MVAPSPQSASEAPADVSGVELAGWDPYIVSLTHADRRAADDDAESVVVDTRKGQLMAWLREHKAD